MVHKVAIMQPYFFPYIGYFQLINHVDDFVIYDDIKYTKKGWINRNRFLGPNGPTPFTLPIKSGSDTGNINKRRVSSNFDAKKLLRRFHGAYAKAPFFIRTFDLLTRAIDSPSVNLFDFIFNTLKLTCDHLGMETTLKRSSEIANLSEYRSEERVIATCSKLEATQYINPQNGMSLYNSETFAAQNIELLFLIPELREYDQLSPNFSEGLSIIDVLMFNSVEFTRDILLKDYAIVSPP